MYSATVCVHNLDRRPPIPPSIEMSDAAVKLIEKGIRRVQAMDGVDGGSIAEEPIDIALDTVLCALAAAFNGQPVCAADAYAMVVQIRDRVQELARQRVAVELN